jgi:transcription termination factor NusB
MANRHLSRSVVLQTLFEWDFRTIKNSSDAMDTLERNALEFAPAAGDLPFMQDVLKALLNVKKI